MFRSRRELSNEYLLPKIGVDTAENEPHEVWGKIQFIIHLRPWCDATASNWRRPAQEACEGGERMAGHRFQQIPQSDVRLQLSSRAHVRETVCFRNARFAKLMQCLKSVRISCTRIHQNTYNIIISYNQFSETFPP